MFVGIYFNIIFTRFCFLAQKTFKMSNISALQPGIDFLKFSFFW